MNSKILVIGVVVVLVAAGAAIGVTALNKDDSSSSRELLTETLQVYGNANGDWTIDDDDVDLIKEIIEKNSDDDDSNDIVWEKAYPFADAEFDGVLDQSDVDLAYALAHNTATHVSFYDGLGELMTNVKCNPQKIYAFQIQNAEICAIMGVGDHVVAGGPPIQYYADLLYGEGHAENMWFGSGNYDKLNELEIDMYLVFAPTQKATPTEKLPDTDVVYLGLYTPDCNNLESSAWAQGILEAGYIFNCKERAEGYLEFLIDIKEKIYDVTSEMSDSDKVNVLVSNYAHALTGADTTVTAYTKADTISQAVALAGGYNVAELTTAWTVGYGSTNSVEWLTDLHERGFDLDFVTMHFQRYAWTGEDTSVPVGGYTATDASGMKNAVDSIKTLDVYSTNNIDTDGLIMLPQEFRNGINGGILAAAYFFEAFYPEEAEDIGFSADECMKEFCETWLQLPNYSFDDHRDATIYWPARDA